jgi:aldehyde dehydrogenase (NAD+)
MLTFLRSLGIATENPAACAGPGKWIRGSGAPIASENPTTGRPIARVRTAGRADTETVVERAHAAFLSWRMVPAPKRGEVVRQLGEALRKHKEPLGRLVSLEMGKILAEGLGEVQEMIDVCDFAVGLSRQLYGLSMHSERPGHRMAEQWHPLGPVGVVTAFNFPVAVWAWNAAIAAVCGDTVVWKPSSKVPLCALAVQRICNDVMKKNGVTGVFNLAIGGGESVGEALLRDPRVPLVSFTGSVRMGRHVAQTVAGRLGRTLLELGGNNAIIVTPDADLGLALRAILFGAVGTTGQRCTTTRRLIVHRSVATELTRRLVRAYKQVSIGDPLASSTLMGPLIDAAAVDDMMRALAVLKKHGGRVLVGGKRLDRPGHFVTPCLATATPDNPVVTEETFAPILYLMEYDTLDEAIAIHNGVPQGLSSAIFTGDLIAAETFLSARGSDCGIANVNIGTSGAEIGGAFGGEKETGGGRESGSDSWKAYMRRQTNTVNWSKDLPLAQGIRFGGNDK